MMILTSLGLSVLFLSGSDVKAPERVPAIAGPRVVRLLDGPLPLTRPLVRVAQSPQGVAQRPSGQHIPEAAARCIWYYSPYPLIFSKAAGVTEVFYLNGNTAALTQYDGHPEWVHLSDSWVGGANPWNVTAATIVTAGDGSVWLKIEADHAEVSDALRASGQAAAGSMPPVPKKSLPTAARAFDLGDVPGALTITLDPTSDSACRQQWLPVWYR